MINDIINQLNNIKKHIHNIKIHNFNDLNNFKIKYLGKNGIINILIKNIHNIKLLNDKKKIGKKINDIKNEIKDIINNNYIKFNNKKYDLFLKEDLTKEIKILSNIGSIHPISIIKNKIIKLFNKIGFMIIDGPEIEDDWHNFTALNFPKHHPSRDMQDTFFIDKNNLLRTHTSSIQIRYIKKNKPPIRIISFGKVFRRETISSRSHCMFHQLEGVYIDNNVSFHDLKQIIEYFIKSLFGNIKIRFRPSYFPFTEPSAEIDIFWGLNNKQDYKITKGTGWLEIMGCGMIDPNVLKNVNIDNNIFSGFAFGIGIERIAIIIYKINDIRLLFNNDIRFLKQFKSE